MPTSKKCLKPCAYVQDVSIESTPCSTLCGQKKLTFFIRFALFLFPLERTHFSILLCCFFFLHKCYFHAKCLPLGHLLVADSVETRKKKMLIRHRLLVPWHQSSVQPPRWSWCGVRTLLCSARLECHIIAEVAQLEAISWLFANLTALLGSPPLPGQRFLCSSSERNIQKSIKL